MSRLAELGICGNFYSAIKSSYSTTLNAVPLNGEIVRWFETQQGTKQGDNQSPTHFSIYVNGLLRELINSGLGVKVAETLVTVLAYANDLVLIAPTQAGLQQLINITERWCKTWRLQVNSDKTKIMHVRNSGVAETKYKFTYQGTELDKSIVINIWVLLLVLMERLRQEWKYCLNQEKGH